MTIHDIMEHLPEGMKHLLDAVSAAAALGTIVSILPNLAALLTVIWTGLRILDWIQARREGRRLKD